MSSGGLFKPVQCCKSNDGVAIVEDLDKLDKTGSSWAVSLDPGKKLGQMEELCD